MNENDSMTRSSHRAAKIDRSRERKAAIAGGIGSFIEWYDYGLYALAAALYLAPLFFSGVSPAAGAMLAFGTFAAGFIARPIGGLVLGYAGDKYGRKPVLLFSVILMGAATALMGLLPTYESAGIISPILLVLLRVVQGFGAGAELAGAFVYVTESSTPKRRGFFGSFPAASIPVGAVVASLVFLTLEAILTEDQMTSFGWRIPFLISLIGMVAAVAIRSSLHDTPEFEQKAKSTAKSNTKAAIIRTLRANPRAAVAAFLAPTVVGVGGYGFKVFAISYARNELGISSTVTLIAFFIFSVVAIGTVLMFGLLCDKYGSATIMLYGAVFFAVGTIPAFALMETGNATIIVVVLTVMYAGGWAAVAAAQGQFLTGLFPVESRFTNVAVTRELNQALVAGPTPLVATALVGVASGAPWLAAGFIALGGVLSVVGVLVGRHIGWHSHDVPTADPAAEPARGASSRAEA